jgi:LuxR family maltose regulon positive regulatory protein
MARADHAAAGADRPAIGVGARTARAPAETGGLVSRTALVNRLRAAPTPSVVLITAPAGFGKTTVLAQWAVRDERPFVWIATDRRDREPAGFLEHLAEALDDVVSLEPHVLEAVADPGPSIWTSALPRLAGSLLAAPPLVVAIDDAHLLGTSEVHEVVAALAAHLPEGSMLVVSGRSSSPLPVPVLRAAGVVVEVGIDELAFTPREAQLLLRAAGRADDLESATALVHELEGWPATLALAADDPHGSAATRIRAVETYVQGEFLARLPPALRRFLRRASVLDELTASLCDAVLGEEGSGAALAAAERTGPILVAVDGEPATYRYRRLFRDALRRELVAREADLAPVLHARAADWYERHGLPESTVRHALAGGDLDRAARTFSAIALPLYHAGRAIHVEAWLGRLDESALLARHPAVAAQGSLIHALRGRPEDAQRWVAAAEAGSAALGRARAVAVRAAAAAVRSVLCDDGAYQMVADAETALAGLSRDDGFRPVALTALGFGYVLLGQDARADAILAFAASEAARLGATDTHAIAVAQRSVIAAERDDPEAAGTLALEAREIVDEGGLLGYETCAIALAASARRSLRQGRWEDARADLAQARISGVRGGSTAPWLAVQTAIELGRAHVALRETGAARSLLDDLHAQLRVHRHLGTLVDDVDALEHDLEHDSTTAREGSGLTAAELRLLPFLTTHLSFREIGERLYVSRNTIKTQAISIYRKLGATSRSDAVAVAARLGLVDPCARAERGEHA